MARNGDWAASGDEVAGDVFKIEPPSDPKLKRGKRFCSSPATFVVLWTFGEGELTLNVYSGDAAPTRQSGCRFALRDVFLRAPLNLSVSCQ